MSSAEEDLELYADGELSLSVIPAKAGIQAALNTMDLKVVFGHRYKHPAP